MSSRSLKAKSRDVPQTSFEPATYEAPLPDHVFAANSETYVPDIIPEVNEILWGGFQEGWGSDDDAREHMIRDIMEEHEPQHACHDLQDEWQEPQFCFDLDLGIFFPPPIQDGHEWLYIVDWNGIESSQNEIYWNRLLQSGPLMYRLRKNIDINFCMYECKNCLQRFAPILVDMSDDYPEDLPFPVSCSAFLPMGIDLT